MMKVQIFNNTKDYHHGCTKVMEYLYNDLQENGHTILGSVTGSDDFRPEVEMQFMEADIIIVNGEGTMHHNSPIAHQLLSVIKNAKILGKKTALINTVWESMTIDDEMKDVLSNTYISVREEKSKYAMYESIKLSVDVHLDLSYFIDVPKKITPQRDLVVGKFFIQHDYRPKNVSVIDIFKHDWDTIVNILRSANWFITGRHHELYAACKARCPFAALSGNTWKNEGLMQTANVEIPIESSILPHDKIPYFLDRCKEHFLEYEKLFDWMECQEKFSSTRIVQN